MAEASPFDEGFMTLRRSSPSTRRSRSERAPVSSSFERIPLLLREGERLEVQVLRADPDEKTGKQDSSQSREESHKGDLLSSLAPAF
jgi:hypothetical protein